MARPQTFESLRAKTPKKEVVPFKIDLTKLNQINQKLQSTKAI